MESQLQALTKWRAGERVTQSSPGVELSDAAMVPGPMGPMPIWIGGVGREKTLRMAGRYADGWNAAYVPPAEYRELNGILDDWCAKAGRDPSSVERSINLSYGLSTDDVSVVKDRLHSQWGAGAERIIAGSLLFHAPCTESISYDEPCISFFQRTLSKMKNSFSGPNIAPSAMPVLFK